MSPPRTSWRALEEQHGAAIGVALGRSIGERAREARVATGAIGVAYGPKRRGGRTTDEASVMFLVESKHEVRGVVVPPTIAGLETDVLEVGPVRTRRPESTVLRRDAFSTRVDRPVPWGAGIGAVESGTLGALVRRVGDPRHRYLLSNNHVIANWGDARVGDRIYQPSSLPDEDEDWIAELTRWETLRGLDQDPAATNTVDAAIAQVRTPWRRYVSDRHRAGEYRGRIWSWRKTADIPVGLSVSHVGATTGSQPGEVLAFVDQLEVDLGPPVGRARFVDQLVIAARGFGGDSGALAFCPSDGSAIGLLFAMSEVRALVEDGVAVEDRRLPRDPVVIANPIESVQRALSIRVADAAWRPPAGVTRAAYRRAAAAARALSTALSREAERARVEVVPSRQGVVLLVETATPLAVPRDFEGWRVRCRRVTAT